MNDASYNDNAKSSEEQYNDWLTDKQNILMVVAVLLATMAFQAGMNPPGGVWQDDSKLEFDTNQSLFNYYASDKCTGWGSRLYLRPRYNPSSSAASAFYGPQDCVIEDIWTAAISNHTGFFPHLLRYAGTSIMAYRKPNSYLFTYSENYLVFT